MVNAIIRNNIHIYLYYNYFEKIENNLPIKGLLIGVLVGIFGIILELFCGGMANIYWIILFLIVSISGYLGGLLVEKRRGNKLKSPV